MGRIYLFFFWSFWSIAAMAQLSDTIALPEVSVTASRFRIDAAPVAADCLDSLQLQQFPSSNIAEILQQNTSVFIKSYGLGSIATSSIRGGSAGHTLVVWNGFSLQNSMLGQSDFSLLPAFFFDKLEVQYGGNGALWGSAAIGGVVQLQSQMKPQHSLGFRMNIGSFGAYSGAVKINLSKGKWFFSSRLFNQKANNDFKYQIREDLPEVRQSHAAFQQVGILQNIRYQASERQLWSGSFWVQRMNREIPPTTTQNQSVATQSDEQYRSTLNWQYQFNNSILQARTAWFDEQIHYIDSLAGVDAESEAQTSISEVEWKGQFSKKIDVHLGLHYTYLKAKAQGYPDGVRQNRVAAFAALRGNYSKWNWSAEVRQEQVDGEFVPTTPSAQIAWQLLPEWKVAGKMARIYKIPTFNDLYWSPGGNPDLLPESGWSQEVSLLPELGENLDLRFTVFHRNLHDRILWQPQENSFFWSPENVEQVWSRGLESRLNFHRKQGDFDCNIRLGYDYIRSTVKAAKDETTVGKQLVYTPEHQGFSNLSIHYKSFQFHYQQNYTGRVLIQQKGEAYLNAYQVGNGSLGYDWKWATFRGNILFKINNIWNVNYRIIDRRPMAGRNFELRFLVDWSLNTKKTM